MTLRSSARQARNMVAIEVEYRSNKGNQLRSLFSSPEKIHQPLLLRLPVVVVAVVSVCFHCSFRWENDLSLLLLLLHPSCWTPKFQSSLKPRTVSTYVPPPNSTSITRNRSSPIEITAPTALLLPSSKNNEQQQTTAVHYIHHRRYSTIDPN